MKVTSTFDPERLADIRYTQLFENLRESCVEVDVLPDVDPNNLEGILSTYKERLAGADMVFHLPAYTRKQLDSAFDSDFFVWTKKMTAEGLEWDSDDFYRLHKGRESKEEGFIQQLSDYVKSLRDSGVILDADVYIKELDEVYTILDEAGLPRIRRMSVEGWKANKSFPAVFKMKDTSRGNGVYFLENDDQFRKMFDPKYIIGDHNSTSGRFSGEEFNVSELIECPSDHYTHYRVLTLGDGTILGAVLSYSAFRKRDDERVIGDEYEIFDSPESVLFLNRRNIISNKSGGGSQIPLNPNDDSKIIDEYEKSILEEHGINDQKIPAKLAEQASCAAERFGKEGLYVLGQDWIQGKDGTFYCLEVNNAPQFGIFNTLYNNGKGNDSVAERIGAEKIGDGILAHLERKVNEVKNDRD